MPRLIYPLMFTFESPPPTIVQLVVPLNRDGQSENGLAKAVPPKQQIIDLRVGDWLRFRDKVRKITQIEALHDAHIPTIRPLPSLILSRGKDADTVPPSKRIQSARINVASESPVCPSQKSNEIRLNCLGSP